MESDKPSSFVPQNQLPQYRPPRISVDARWLVVILLLVIIAMVLGIWGGRLAGTASHILSPDTFDKGLLQAFVPYNVTFALAKGYTFAFIVSSIPAYFGYFVQGGALEIGRASTTAVVTSCIMILLSDYVLAALLL